MALWALRGGVFLVGGVVGWFLSPLINRLLAGFFRGFNWFFARLTDAYGRTVALVLRLSVVVLVIYGGLIGLTYLGFTTVPVGFIPAQDKGYLIVDIQLPYGASWSALTRCSCGPQTSFWKCPAWRMPWALLASPGPHGRIAPMPERSLRR